MFGPRRAGRLWGAALGYDRRSPWVPYVGLKDPGGRGPHLAFQRTRDHSANHLHVDLYSDDPDVDAERLVGLGAQQVAQIEAGDTWWWVMRDPAGNEFCLIAAQGADRSAAIHTRLSGPSSRNRRVTPPQGPALVAQTRKDRSSA